MSYITDVAPGNKNLLEDLIKQIDEERGRLSKEYFDLHMELDKHRGKMLDDTDMPEVIRLVEAIQDKFMELYPLFTFIGYQHQVAITMTNGFDQFLNDIKKANEHVEVN